MKVALYARRSHVTQAASIDTQLELLEQEAVRRGWEIVHRYRETKTGAMPVRERPAFRQLWGAIGRGEVETIAVVRVDRIARNTEDMLGLFRALKEKHVSVVSLNEPMLSTDGPQGEFILTIMAAVSTFERGLLRQRINEGIARAKAAGRVLGPKRILIDRERVAALRAEGKSFAQVARIMGVPVMRAYRANRPSNRGKHGTSQKL
jgi:DNA invertase Pin-like site-specific DNA recombinase